MDGIISVQVCGVILLYMKSIIYSPYLMEETTVAPI